MAEFRRPKVFVDADVLIAGSASTAGASHMILRLGELGLIDATSSAQARSEAERNLARKLPAWLPAFRALADAACEWVDDPSPEQIDAVRGQADPKDQPILASAVAAGCEWLVTFNISDYRPSVGSIRVSQPGEFVQAIREMLERMAES
jgi:predicted nucleic acid-binding protein